MKSGSKMLKKLNQTARVDAPSNENDWKGNPVNRSQWSRPAAKTSDEKVGFATISVKLRPEEAVEFKLVCDELGISRNLAMRTMARQVGGFLEVGDTMLEEMRDVTRQITSIAISINLIAKAGSQSQQPDHIAFMIERSELGVQLSRIEQMMQLVLNVAQRRTDGLSKLANAATKS